MIVDDPVHVYPTYGKEHEYSSDCWCLPDRIQEATEEHDAVYVHHLEQ